MWHRHVETSERGWVDWVKKQDSLDRTIRRASAAACANNMQSTDPSAGPKGDPLDSCHNTTSRILSPARLCAQRILPIFVQCRPSAGKILAVSTVCSTKACGSLKGARLGGHRAGRSVSVLKLNGYLTSESGRRTRPSDMKRNKREAGGGVRATGVGQPSLPSSPPNCGPTANCGASGPRSSARHALPAAMLPSSSRSPLLLMQPCRCSTNMNVVRARPRTPRPCQVTSLCRTCRTCRGLGHCQVEPPCLSVSPCTNWLNWASFRASQASQDPAFPRNPATVCQGLPGGGGG